MVQQADEEIEMRVEQVRALFADDAEGFGTAVLDAGLVCLQPFHDVRDQTRVPDRLAGESLRIQGCLEGCGQVERS